MNVLRGVGAVPTQLGAARQARGASGFRMPQARSSATGPTIGAEGASAAEEVGLAGMLALQEMPHRNGADREVLRRGKDLLAALAEIQQAMLGVRVGDPARLEKLAAGLPNADDPVLRDVVAAIALRARIEAARFSMRSEGDSRESIKSS